MSSITAILTGYRRPHALARQVDAVRGQSAVPKALWLWANAPDAALNQAIGGLRFDRVVTSSDNAHVHARFSLALLAPTEYVAVFDDDTIPGPHWFSNCLRTMSETPGILGSAGVTLEGHGYRERRLSGWRTPSEETVEVDLVGHAWFLRTEWLRHLFAAPPVTGTNGEDIELCARAWRLAGVRTFCPPHPPEDRRLWGSLHGSELGEDAAASSRRAEHLDERDRIVRAEIAAGWQPLFLRGNAESSSPATARPPATAALPPATGGMELPFAMEQVAPIRETVASWDRLVQAVPSTAKTLLVLGHGDVGRLKSKSRRIERTEKLDRRPGTADRLDQEALLAAIPSRGVFDCILAGEALERVSRPQDVLRALRPQLAEDGRLLATFQNVRYAPTVQALLGGRWPFRHGGNRPRDPLRFFTRAEIEKLFFRAGWNVELTPLTASLHEAWQAAGRPGRVDVGSLRIDDLPASVAEEFFVPLYLASATPCPKTEYGLTSIVIVTYNELPLTRACLTSVRYRTDEPYEIIVVDNGSTDGTPDFLDSLAGIRVIRNPKNCGFLHAANQGIHAAAGAQVLLLNNDTVVTTGWLRRLLDALLQDSKIGLVGPYTNKASGTQEVPIAYDTDLVGLDGFAWEWARQRSGRVRDVHRLVGFCLLIRRAVIDAVGGLDERYGIGCFEDDDYTREALKAGFRTVIADDAFVHHFGSATFRNSGIDFAELMRRNEAIFRKKWGLPGVSEEASGAAPGGTGLQNGYALARGSQGGLLLRRSRKLVSACIIARDNAKTIAACLESVRPCVDELIVVDTGSQDETPAIARRLGARVYSFSWCDSFAAARNESLKYATSEWIFWIDTDDTVDADQAAAIRHLAATTSDPTILGYTIKVLCYGSETEGRFGTEAVDHVKLFRNRRNLRFEGRLHEQIIPSITRAGGQVILTDLFVRHSGYDHSPEGQKRKRERDFRLLKLQLAERENYPFTLFNLGMTHASVGEHQEAIRYLRQSLEHSAPHESHVRKVYAWLVLCHTRLGKHQDALVASEAGLSHYPRDLELRFRRAIVLQELGKTREAVSVYEDILQNPDERHFASVVEGMGSYLTRHNLAVSYEDLGDFAAAETNWRQLVGDYPDYGPGWLGLGQCLARQDQSHEAGAIAERLVADSDSRLRSSGLLLRAGLAELRGDVLDAQINFTAAAEARLNDPEPQRRLCHSLAMHGAAEEQVAAFHELIRRDPEDPSAYHNLASAYMQLNRPEDAVTAYQRSLELRPDALGTLVQLSLALGESGRVREALLTAERAVAVCPQDPVARDALARQRRAAQCGRDRFSRSADTSA